MLLDRSFSVAFSSIPQGDCVVICHPGQVPPSGTRSGIQNVLISSVSSGFRISPTCGRLVRNDGFEVL